MADETTKTMEAGKALEIVYEMAKTLRQELGDFTIIYKMTKRLYHKNNEFVCAKSPHELQMALDTVEDFIVNNFDEND